jgi:hypothetical protein
MKKVKLNTIGKIKLNSFRPLCSNQLGIIAINNYHFPPFIDGSCRREPDFQNTFPSITSLCRKSRFAPHLKKDDIIVYMTVRGKFPPFKKGHHLVAILQVNKVFKNHKDGFKWYSKKKLPIPSNCLVQNNLPYMFDQTIGNLNSKKLEKRYLLFSPQKQLIYGRARLKNWDNNYWKISTQWPCFIKTTSIYLNYCDPPQITRNDFNRIFGKIPNTQTPKKISKKQLHDLGKLIDLDFRIK